MNLVVGASAVGGFGLVVYRQAAEKNGIGGFGLYDAIWFHLFPRPPSVCAFSG